MANNTSMPGSPASSRGVLADEGYPLTMLAADMCRLLNIHINTLYRRIEAGQVPAYERVGSGAHQRYEWWRPTVERWMQNRRNLRRSA